MHRIWFVVGYIRLLTTAGLWGVVVVNTKTCFYVKLYWKLVPFIFCGIVTKIIRVALSVLDISVASKDKIKDSLLEYLIRHARTTTSYKAFTLCFDVLMILLLFVLFAIFLFLSKWYMLPGFSPEVSQLVVHYA